MFSRLLKHEWRACAPLLGLLSLAAGGIALLATIVLRILVNYADRLIEGTEGWGVIIVVALGVFLFFSVVALCVYAVAVQFILLYRFYKNKYTDEGYLTFTLPVKTTHIFWSSFLNMLIWMVISFAVVIVVAFLALLFGTAKEGLVNPDIFDVVKGLIELLGNINLELLLRDNLSIPYLVILILSVLTAPFYGLFIPMACITAGAVLAKKHKILASFGIYYAVNFAVGIVTSVASIAPTMFMMGNGDIAAYYTISVGIQLVITLALTIGAYFFTIHVMKRRLNLP